MGSFNEQALAEFQREVDAAAAEEDRLEALGTDAVASLKVEFLAALNGAKAEVFTPYFNSNGVALKRSDPIGDALQDTLLNPTVLRALMKALSESQCPHVAAFKVEAAKQHAFSYCDALVALEDRQ